MTPVPEMDERLRHAVQGALKRPPESLYDLKKVKALNDFCYFGDPYYQEKRDGQEPGDFSVIGQMENLHTLVFGSPRSQQIPTVLAADFSFLAQCKRLRACLKSPRACLGGVFSVLTALKILAIRQDACGFLPCRAKNPLANPYTSRY